MLALRRCAVAKGLEFNAMTRKIQVHQVDAFTRIASPVTPPVSCSTRTASPKPRCSPSRASSTTPTRLSFSRRTTASTACARASSRPAPRSVSSVTRRWRRTTCCRGGHSAPRHVRQKSKAGVVDIEVRGVEEDRSIAIRQTAPPLGRELNDRERLAVLDALALATDDLDPRCPLRIVGSSSTRLHDRRAQRGRAQTSQARLSAA